MVALVGKLPERLRAARAEINRGSARRRGGVATPISSTSPGEGSRSPLLILLQAALPMLSRKRRETESGERIAAWPAPRPARTGMVGGLAMGILDPHRAALDADDSIRVVAELEHVAAEDSSTGENPRSPCRSSGFSGLEQHLVNRQLSGDGAARRQRP